MPTNNHFFLNINKPAGITAHDVVSQVRKILRIKQVGHAGTLDPMATGVLPIAVGACCRLLSYLSNDKTYVTEILLGQRTTTDDVEGEVIERSDNIPQADQITETLKSFVGQIDQVPPNYSAVHYQGQRLYALARAGKLPDDIKARKVTIHAIEVLDCAPPVVRARIICGSGTYIRAIARDLGDALDCGGCMQSLVREQAGPFTLNNSITLAELAKLAQEDLLANAIINPAAVLGLPSLSVDDVVAHKLANGQILPASTIDNKNLTLGSTLGSLPQSTPLSAPESAPLLLVTCNDKLVALCRRINDGELKPEVVVANAK